MTDDATYWVAGKPHLFPAAGEKTKAQIYKYMQAPSIFKDGLAHTIGAVTAEDDRVAIEVEVRGIAPGGKLYNNTYHYLFIFPGREDCEGKGVRGYVPCRRNLLSLALDRAPCSPGPRLRCSGDLP